MPSHDLATTRVGGRTCSLPQADTAAQQHQRRLERQKKQGTWRYYHQTGVPPWTAPGIAGAPPPGEMQANWLWQLTMTGLKLVRARLRMHWQWARLDRSKAAHRDPFAKFTALYYSKTKHLPPDHIVHRWKRDDEFAAQRLNGLCPWFLERIGSLPANFPCTDEDLRGVLPPQHRLEALLQAGRLYLTNHHELAQARRTNGRYLCAPICLFWTDDAGVLMPLAIQLLQDPGQAPIFTPKDAPGLWLAAKMWANCCDLHVHDMFIHTTTFHFVMEVVWLAANRQLADRHPLKAFLRPHFAVTVAIGAGVRATIGSGGPLGAIHTFGGGAGTWDFIASKYSTWSTTELNMDHHFARRGVLEIKGFYFRDDCLQWWHETLRYCQAMVEALYTDDAAVVADEEVQAWYAEMTDPALGGLKGLPADLGGQLANRSDLAELLARVVFTCGPKHSVIRNLGIQYDFFVPNMPAMFHLPPPTSRDDIAETVLAAALPPPRWTILQMALMESIDQPAALFNAIGDYPPEYMAEAGPAALQVVRNWQSTLQRIEADLQARNRTLADRPYEALLPSQCFASIWN